MTEQPTVDDGTVTLSDLFVIVSQAQRPGGDGVLRLNDPSEHAPDEGRVGRDPAGGFYIGAGDEWVHSDDIALAHPALDGLESGLDDHVDEPEGVHGAGDGEYVVLTDRDDQAVDYDDVENVPSEFPPEMHSDEEHDETVPSSSDVDAVASDLDDHEQDADNPHETTLEETRAESNQLAGDVDFDGNSALDVSVVGHTPVDVRTLSDPQAGWVAYHDGAGDHTEGPAHYDGSDWLSTIDGSTIDD